jgi:chromosome segregation ATPase
VSTKGNSHQRSQQSVYNLPSDQLRPQNQTDTSPEQLFEQLKQSEQKAAEIALQKEYLTGTCESQANYIRELTAKVQTMQNEVYEKQNALESQQSKSDDSKLQIEQLNKQLQEANLASEQLKETLGLTQNQNQPEQTALQVENLTKQLNDAKESWQKDLLMKKPPPN